MSYDPYASESSGDHETTTDQVYLRHIRQELQHVTAALGPLSELVLELRTLNTNLNSIDSRLDYLAQLVGAGGWR